MSDLHYCIRCLRKKPWSAALVIAALSAGLALNGVMFTVVNSLLLRPLPFERPGELVDIGQIPRSLPVVELTRARSFQGTAGFTLVNHPVGNGNILPVLGYRSSANLFDVLGVKAAIGRLFTARDDPANAPPVVVLSYSYWRQLSGDPKLIGHTLTIASEPHTIVGVLPPEFTLVNRNANIWIPTSGPQSRIVARLASGVSSAQAEAELRSIAAAMDPASAPANPDQRIQVRALARPLADVNTTQTVLLLQAAAIFLLVITGANVGSVLLVQSKARHKEFAIRAAVGAGRFQILRQLMIESAVLTAAGSALGLLLTRASLGLVATRLPQGIFARMVAPGGLVIDYRVLAFSALWSLLTVLLCGVASAMSSWRLDLLSELRGSGSGPDRNRAWLGQVLVSGEVALAITLVTAAGLTFKGLHGLETASLGFNPQSVLRVRFEPPAELYPGPAQRDPLFAELLQSIQAIPGVQTAGGIAPQLFPFSGAVTPTSRFEIEPAAEEDVRADVLVVSPEYFRAVGVPLLRGRWLSAADSANSPPVIVISQAFAQRYWRRESPIGRRIRLYGSRADSPWASIVGVVGDVRNAARVEPQRIVYRPLAQSSATGIAVMIRTGLRDPMSLAPALRSRMAAIGPEVPQYPIVDLASAVLDYRDPQRFTAGLWGSFAAFGLLLAALGVFGAMHTWVRMHARELGIRMALGARPADVLALVFKRALTACFAGLVAGLAGAAGLRTILASQLYGVSATDPAVFSAVSVLILLVGLLAALVPARSAARVDPVRSLRAE